MCRVQSRPDDGNCEWKFALLVTVCACAVVEGGLTAVVVWGC